MTPSAEIEPGPHWWKASALTTRPFPYHKFRVTNSEWSRLRVEPTTVSVLVLKFPVAWHLKRHLLRDISKDGCKEDHRKWTKLKNVRVGQAQRAEIIVYTDVLITVALVIGQTSSLPTDKLPLSSYHFTVSWIYVFNWQWPWHDQQVTKPRPSQVLHLQQNNLFKPIQRLARHRWVLCLVLLRTHLEERFCDEFSN